MWVIAGLRGGARYKPIGALTFLFSKVFEKRYRGKYFLKIILMKKKLHNQESVDFSKVDSDDFCGSLLG
jgi:hypothetical protein